jgi:hypothetical protein
MVLLMNPWPANKLSWKADITSGTIDSGMIGSNFDPTTLYKILFNLITSSEECLATNSSPASHCAATSLFLSI